MSLKALRFLLLNSLGLFLLLSNSLAQAQVVVPTTPSGSTSSPSTNTPNSTTVNSPVRFSCQFYNGQYTVVYQPESQPGKYYPWAAPGSLGGGWTPERRCDAIANRLELYRPDGLQELDVSRTNNENIICVTTEAQPSCRIVLTVPRNKDPYNVRNSIFQNLINADDGQDTIAVNTFANPGNGSYNEIYNLGRTILGGGNNRGNSSNSNNRANSSRSGINLKPFLDRKDGGTATNLRNGFSINRQSPPSGGTRLNPNRFR